MSPSDAPTQPPRAKRPIWKKLALVLVLFSLIPTVTLGAVLLERNAEMIRTSSREVRLTATESLSILLDVMIADATEQLIAIAQALGNPELDGPIKLGLVQTLVSSSSSIDHAMIFDAQGKHIDTIKNNNLTYTPDTSDLTEDTRQSIMKDGKFISAQWVKNTQSSRMRMGVPLQTPEGTLTGYVISDVSLSAVQQRQKQLVDEKFQGDPNALYLLNNNAQTLLDTHTSDIDSELTERARELGKLKGVASSEEVKESSGEHSLATFKPLEQAPWIVIARVPRSVAYAPLYQMRIGVLIGLLLILIIGIFVSILFSRQITQPINALMEQCKALAQRHFSHRITLASNDELGVLAHTLNDSAQQLADSEEELLRQERIKNDLSRYLPLELVERVVVDGTEDLNMKGKSQEITVLFADVVGFTELCKTLSPEATVTILNELFTILTEIIFRHHGVVDKFIGDSIMAFWGAPEANEDHAVDACTAAEEILSWLELGNVTWQKRYGVTVELAIGLHSGPAVVGNVGSDTRMAYTAIGDTVNLAARLEAIARPNQILTTRQTANLIDDLFEVHYAGERLMPGHEEPLEIFEVTP